MTERELLCDFSEAAIAELKKLSERSVVNRGARRDMRGEPWCSIDNDESEDLDQLTLARTLQNGDLIALVAVSDVDELVEKGSAIDHHAWHNTTSIYTAPAVFPMLPNELCNNLTSLKLEESRPANVMEMHITHDGVMKGFEIYAATVMNKAKLTYKRVDAWLEVGSDVPEEVARVPGLAENLKLQNQCAQILRGQRHQHGALDLDSLESRPSFVNDNVEGLAVEGPNKARQLIEDFMIAANVAVSRYLKQKGLTSFRRVVRTPKNWQRIVEIAAEYGSSLPPEPDSVALASFTALQKKKDPDRFPDLSLIIIKLLGKGEYVVELPGAESAGHFGLAVRDYTHSTAPNRRFPDLITQRVLKAALRGHPSPYRVHELVQLAQHCTDMEDAVNKVERKVHKSAAALLLSKRSGEVFDGICTGTNEKATWVRIFSPPCEGKLVQGFEGVRVGERLRVKLTHTDVERGFIDFAKQ